MHVNNYAAIGLGQPSCKRNEFSRDNTESECCSVRAFAKQQKTNRKANVYVGVCVATQPMPPLSVADTANSFWFHCVRERSRRVWLVFSCEMPMKYPTAWHSLSLLLLRCAALAFAHTFRTSVCVCECLCVSVLCSYAYRWLLLVVYYADRTTHSRNNLCACEPVQMYCCQIAYTRTRFVGATRQCTEHKHAPSKPHTLKHTCTKSNTQSDPWENVFSCFHISFGHQHSVVQWVWPWFKLKHFTGRRWVFIRNKNLFSKINCWKVWLWI